MSFSKWITPKNSKAFGASELVKLTGSGPKFAVSQHHWEIRSPLALA
jgi:hypothetical protein